MVNVFSLLTNLPWQKNLLTRLFHKIMKISYVLLKNRLIGNHISRSGSHLVQISSSPAPRIFIFFEKGINFHFRALKLDGTSSNDNRSDLSKKNPF